MSALAQTRTHSSPITNRFADLAPALVENGYAPIPVRPGTKVPAVAAWTDFEVDANACSKYADHSIGLRLGVGGLHALDVDIRDKNCARLALNVIAAEFRGKRGIGVVRIGRSPKFAMLYRDPDGTGWPKHTGATFYTRDESKHKVEILGAGQYLAVFGVHPDTGKEYRWHSTGDPTTVRVEDLPVLSRDEVLRLVVNIERAMEDSGLRRDGNGNVAQLPARNINDDLSAGVVVKACDDVARVESAVMWIAEHTGGFADRDLWVRGCHALKAASVNWTEGKAEELWHRASRFYPDYDETEAARVWATTFPRADGVGAGTIFHIAKELGWKDPVGSSSAGWVVPGVTASEAGLADATISNAVAVVKHYGQLGGVGFYHDVFNDRRCFTDADGKAAEVNDALARNISVAATSQRRLRHMSPALINDAISYVCEQNPRDPAVEWLDSLRWDGVERLDAVLVRGFGAEGTVYNGAVGRTMMLSWVARQYQPGAKVDTMPVLEGAQGIGKSSGIRVLVGSEWFSDALPSMHDVTEFARQLRGKVVFEVPELAAMRKSDTELVKAQLSRQVDRYRDPYERREVDRPRRCCFVGTTNEGAGVGYLADSTGNRRFLPVACVHGVDIGWLLDNREQLWAEAVVRYKAGESWHDLPIEAAKEAQEARRIGDPWEESIAKHLHGHNKNEVSIAELLSVALQVPDERVSATHSKRVATVLRRLGWKPPETSTRRGSAAVRLWTAPGTTNTHEQQR